MTNPGHLQRISWELRAGESHGRSRRCALSLRPGTPGWDTISAREHLFIGTDARSTRPFPRATTCRWQREALVARDVQPSRRRGTESAREGSVAGSQTLHQSMLGRASVVSSGSRQPTASYGFSGFPTGMSSGGSCERESIAAWAALTSGRRACR